MSINTNGNRKRLRSIAMFVYQRVHVKESVFEPPTSFWTITEADGWVENSGSILRVNGLMKNVCVGVILHTARPKRCLQDLTDASLQSSILSLSYQLCAPQGHDVGEIVSRKTVKDHENLIRHWWQLWKPCS